MSSKQPPWLGPFGNSELKVRNSLTSSLVPFVPIRGRQVKWYICGPTVYDSAHLGHARAYITFDILRRILSDYFGYDVLQVMNITDIDDKIIIRARRNYLLTRYLNEIKDGKVKIDQVFTDGVAGFEFEEKEAKSSITELQEKFDAEKDEKVKEDIALELEEEKIKLQNLRNEFSKFQAVQKELKQHKQITPDVIEKTIALINSVSGIFGAAVDQRLASTVNDPSIFRVHANKYETEFLEDMKVLGVRDPDSLTRVSEYVEKIIEYILQIMKNGYCYESNGSVYFDTVSFSRDHHYRKLKPKPPGKDSQPGDRKEDPEKRHPADFALWKKSKKGEPSWSSPWGGGRPGWHIECSAMASDLLGDEIDVHAGGEDLKFPHHDNELAQSEAYSGRQQWINHFWHAGHLNIQGLKMSKSLKNFITIREVLKTYSPRQIRILFLLQRWDTKMNYSPDTLKEAASKEHKIKEFFLSVNVALRKTTVATSPQVYNEKERKLLTKFLESKEKVHESLCDNFNYPGAMENLLTLIAATNKYIIEEDKNPQGFLLQRIAVYVDRILEIFGVKGNNDLSFGFSAQSEGQVDKAAILKSFLDAFCDFRYQVRTAAQEKKALSDILQLCDVVRDRTLPDLGVRLEDVKSGPSVWKLDDPEELKKQRNENERKAKEDAIGKLVRQLTQREKDLKSWKDKSRSPKDLFASRTAEFSAFDPKGFPTKDQKGQEIPPSKVKKLQKEWKKQETAFNDYQTQLGKDPTFVTKAESEIASIQEQLQKLK